MKGISKTYLGTNGMRIHFGGKNATLEMSIRFSLKSRPSERFPRSQIKAEISLRTNLKLIFHKNVGFPIFITKDFEQIY